MKTTYNNFEPFKEAVYAQSDIESYLDSFGIDSLGEVICERSSDDEITVEFNPNRNMIQHISESGELFFDFDENPMKIHLTDKDFEKVISIIREYINNNASEYYYR